VCVFEMCVNCFCCVLCKFWYYVSVSECAERLRCTNVRFVCSHMVDGVCSVVFAYVWLSVNVLSCFVFHFECVNVELWISDQICLLFKWWRVYEFDYEG
jgi:hypothetical protein